MEGPFGRCPTPGVGMGRLHRGPFPTAVPPWGASHRWGSPGCPAYPMLAPAASALTLITR